ncbi:MAG: hypothetical protein H6816_08365 [Phycisphaerales bacterium]|nr:hypothetical protein [Phycisphaerales bacterium]
MDARRWLALAIGWVVLTGAGPARAQIGYDASQSDRIRVWNADYCELAFRKADGRILYILDKTTGQQVSPGNVHGPWVLRFSDGTWLDGQNFSPTNNARKFTYGWDAGSSTLTMNYAATGTYASLARIQVHVTAGPEVDTTLAFTNSSALDVELMAYPVQLSFKRSEIEAVYMPYIEGMKLLPSFFDGYDFWSGYPGQLFADFAYTELTTGSFAVYCVQNLQAPLQPSDWSILRDDTYAGGVRKYHHDYTLALGPGQQWSSPLTVLNVGSSLPDAMAAYWTRTGYDAMPTLADKLGPAKLDALAHAVLLKRDLLQGSWTFSSFQSYLPNLPAGNLLHLVSFWPVGFDENYPDYLPPNTALGSLADLQNLVAAARAGGHLVMPYTNPTWWDNQSPTLATLGTGIVARDRSGGLIYETYGGSHGGYVVSPYDPAVIARQDQTRTEFSSTVPCDFLFEDQLGARGQMYDGNASSPAPMAFNQGLVDVAARSATFLPTMTEGGFDRIAWTETGYCNSHRVGWHWWPASTYTPYPLAQLWAHRNLWFSTHNLAGTTMTNDLTALTYHVSMGYSLSYDLATGDLGWLRLVDRYQKLLVAPLVGEAMVAFEPLAVAGQTRTTFGDGTVVTANASGALLTVGDHVVAVGGFIAEKDGDVTGGVFRTLYGHDLAGFSEHYLLLEHADYRVDVHQPLGDDGAIALPRPANWSDAARVHAVAVTADGATLTQNVTVQAATVQFNYVSQVGNDAVHHFSVFYCRQGDADCDGEVDLADHAAWHDCFAGPGATPDPTAPRTVQDCLDAFDFDGDTDVDLADFGDFAATYDGGW